jgi:phospholipid/cholesterol/gamma-HCH transport system substrate-binding protein
MLFVSWFCIVHSEFRIPHLAGVGMVKLSSEAKVGLLVAVGSVVLLYMTLIVGKYQFGGNKGYILTASFESVSGLDEKAAVRMAGVLIGTVEKVELIDSHARVFMRIDQKVQIRRGSEAAIKTEGLLGDKYVEILPPSAGSGGSPVSAAPGGGAAGGQSKTLQPGENIQVTVSPSDVDKLIGQLSAISDDIKQVTGSLRQVFGTERGVRSMEDILADLRKTTANIQEFSYTLRSDGSELVMRMNELAASLNGVVGENRENLKVTMENVREASRNAELALASIENAAKKIERGEGTLGKLVSDDSMYNNIDSAAKGLSNYVSRVERMQTIMGFRTQYMFPQTQNYFSLELKPQYDQYYLLELTYDPYGRFQRTETTVTPPGETLVTETYEEKLKFSIEFVKRWGNLAARLGLIESVGGIAADYYAFNDKVKFSLDAWNFNSKEPHNEKTHMKATLNYSVNDLLFVNVGYDNFLNKDRAAGFVGAGLRFNDENLKYLLGSVPVPK